MVIRYQVVENPFREGEYIPRVISLDTVELPQIIGDIVRETGLSETDVRAVLNAISDHTLRSLLDGHNVTIEGIGTFSVSLSEKLTSPESEVSEAVEIRVNLRPDAEIVNGLKREATFERVVRAELVPVITLMRDVATDQENRYTAGNIGELLGDNLAFDPAQTDEGLFFIAADGTETRVSTYAQHSNRRIIFLIPAGLSGEQRIVVRTRYDTSRLRSGAYRVPVQPA